MATFDVETWRSRARKRYDVGLAKNAGAAALRFVDDMRSIDGLQKIVDWAAGHGYSISFVPCDSGGVWLREDRRIEINDRSRPREQLHIALHEAGHCLVDRSEVFDDICRSGYSALDEPMSEAETKRLKKTWLHKVDVLIEEVEAWNRGLKLAHRLGIDVDRPAFDRTRARYLKSYMR